ncbi:sulfatase family protein [Mycobacterium kansasii]|uniref:Sulfatase family protein n=1 Tax=Mycobacterium kansasii TaxID=1768 RepID=A0A1V3X6X6_MYCKA|nr:sulfatase family protein [Mycobacterium kansasii]
MIVLLDDVGFGAASTFGGPVPTPTLERIAGAGLRYNQFHTTALCSPTRAALLTGRNHHSAHMGTICEIAYGFPGYDSVLPQSTATVAQVLQMNGYSTALFGKAHFTPTWETGPAGPFDRWPTGLGFERFYGFLGGDTSQYEPALYDQTTPVEPYLGATTITSPRILPTRRSSGSGCRRRRRPTSRFSCTWRPGRHTARTTCGRSGPTGSPASSTTAGMRCGSRHTPARSRWASSHPARS